MANLIRTLLYDDQVSLTLIDTTEPVKEGVRRHGLKGGVAKVYGRALSVMGFFSASLKNERGDVSFVIDGGGSMGVLQAAGNKSLCIRACVQNAAAAGEEEEVLGKNGTLTVVRDDGYSRPFVGSCDFPKTADIDRLFERYFLISEQLPTYLASVVETDEEGEVVFAGVAVLQPLPFTDEKTVEDMPKGERLVEIVKKIGAEGLEKVAKEYFSAKFFGIENRLVAYKCNCSREYLSEVLVTLGEKQLRQILEEEGKIGVHCQFCNTNYTFTEKDIDGILGKK